MSLGADYAGYAVCRCKLRENQMLEVAERVIEG